MSDPQSNYLKNTVPELEEQFIEAVGKIPLFSGLSHELCHQIFQYSKFVKLKPREHVIEQGMFDQEIFILFEGKLNVFIQDSLGKETVIDVMEQPFTLFGERSLLGDPRGASIQADNHTLLLGIDLSSLPDILESFASPEKRENDEVYEQNVAMYTVFATVLTQRLERLVRDQFKLKQKIREFQKRQSSWTQEWLLTRVFNRMCTDDLPAIPEVQEILQKQLKKYHISHPSLSEMLLSPQLSTQQLYMEMVRLNTLEELDQMNDVILDFVSDLATFFYNHPDYTNLFHINLMEIHQIPAMTTLSDFLNSLYHSIAKSGILAQPLPKATLLEMILTENHITPLLFVEALQKNGWVKDQFSLAYTIYLICQRGLYTIAEANNKIRDYVQFLNTYGIPKQSSQTSAKQSHTLIEEFVQMYEQQEATFPQKDSSQEPASPQDEAEALLKSMGL